MIRRSHNGDGGAVLPLVALVLTTLVLFTAIAIDLGYARVIRRDLQAVADVTSLDLVRRLDGSTRVAYETPGTPQYIAMNAAISESRNRNDFAAQSGRTFTIDYGTVDPATNVFTSSAAIVRPTAVRVTATERFDYFFQPGGITPSRSAVATIRPNADFSVGSFLVGADPNLNRRLLNRFLPRFVGSATDDLNLDLVSYEGLASGSFDLGVLAGELGFASSDALLDAGAQNSRGVYLATAAAMRQGGNTAGAAVFERMAGEVDSGSTVDVGGVFVSQGGDDNEGEVGIARPVPARSFLLGTAYLIDGNNFLTIPNFDIGVAGISSTNLSISVVEAPQICTECQIGDVVNTGQVVVTLQNTINTPAVVAGLSGVTLTGTLDTTTEAAGANGTMNAAACAGSASSPGINIGVSTNPITTTASENLTLQRTGLLGTLLQLNVTSASALASGSGGSAVFEHATEFLPPVGTGSPKRVGSPSLGLSTALSANGSNSTTLNLPLGILSATVTNAANAALNPILTGIDNFVVRQLSSALGLNLGGADIAAIRLRCSVPQLVG